MEVGNTAQSLIVILVILGFLSALLWAIKVYGPRLGIGKFRASRDLVLEDHISLGPKRDACVLRYKDKRYLLGVTDQCVSLISKIDQEETQGGQGVSDPG